MGVAGGRVWLITGASTGLGRALAEVVLEHGDRVVATARDVTTVRDLVRDQPDAALAARLDVTDPDSVQAAVTAAISTFGRIDVAVNNAGYGARGALEELSDREFRRQFETNLFGVATVTRAVLPHFRRQRSGHFVQVSSVAGVTAMLGGTAYAASKFALEGLSEGLAAELAHLGIGVTIVEPGPFRTDFAGRSIHWAEPLPDYATVTAPARKAFDAMDGTQPGDPVRAAHAIVAALDLDPTPLRLPLGAAAFTRIREVLTARLAELDTVEHLGLATAISDA